MPTNQRQELPTNQGFSKLCILCNPQIKYCDLLFYLGDAEESKKAEKSKKAKEVSVVLWRCGSEKNDIQIKCLLRHLLGLTLGGEYLGGPSNLDAPKIYEAVQKYLGYQLENGTWSDEKLVREVVDEVVVRMFPLSWTKLKDPERWLILVRLGFPGRLSAKKVQSLYSNEHTFHSLEELGGLLGAHDAYQQRDQRSARRKAAQSKAMERLKEDNRKQQRLQDPLLHAVARDSTIYEACDLLKPKESRLPILRKIRDIVCRKISSGEVSEIPVDKRQFVAATIEDMYDVLWSKSGLVRADTKKRNEDLARAWGNRVASLTRPLAWEDFRDQYLEKCFMLCLTREIVDYPAVIERFDRLCHLCYDDENKTFTE